MLESGLYQNNLTSIINLGQFMKFLFLAVMLVLFGISVIIASTPDPTTTPTTHVDMETHGASTFYVKGEILGLGPVNMMVDTGSGYSTINEQSLEILKANGTARYVKDLVGILANGEKMRVPVYLLSAVSIGENCWIHDVEAAVFPGKTRQIIGLSALRKTAPFLFSMDPPELTLSHCTSLHS